MKIMLLGSGAREHALAKSVKASRYPNQLFALALHDNPAIRSLCEAYVIGDPCDAILVVTIAKQYGIDYAIIGPEAPLAAGVADGLHALGIATFGPTRALAQIESSKSFARELLAESQSSYQPNYQVFSSKEGMQDFIEKCSGHYVIKADGLMSGKGVKVSGEHLNSLEDAYHFADEIFAKGQTFVMEQKLLGIEFSLLSLTDGITVKHFPLVQDHKRAYDHDEGPNTGGMGSYSCLDGKLPFLTDTDIAIAQALNEKALECLQAKTGQTYQGILYGGYMLTDRGVMNIEYNARLGDPEAMNSLSLLETDFISLLMALKNQTLHECDLIFERKASVCIYAVPSGYPDAPTQGLIAMRDDILQEEGIYIGGIEKQRDCFQMTGSRALAVCIKDVCMDRARGRALAVLASIQGDFFYRTDIASWPSIAKKMAMLKHIQPSWHRKKQNVAILCSLRGRSIDAFIESLPCHPFYQVRAIITHDPHAPIIEKAKQWNIPAYCISRQDKTKEMIDQMILDQFKQDQVDLIVLVGYMRILGKLVVNALPTMNVHPSLLPNHKGLMDLAVHQAVLDQQEKETGVTLHWVTEAVDEGPVIKQNTIQVDPFLCAQSLKTKVQQLESESFIEVFQNPYLTQEWQMLCKEAC